ncbi:MAG TPA: SHOCT domain-containing protein [Anaerolineae bacterium]|nr:SHOCT domain-containing protein [Anaerolineae bacterium]
MMGFGLGMGLLGFIWMLLFWVGLIILAIWLVGLLFPSMKTRQDTDNQKTLSAQEILKTRYAQGELTAEQYREMLQTVQQ